MKRRDRLVEAEPSPGALRQLHDAVVDGRLGRAVRRHDQRATGPSRWGGGGRSWERERRAPGTARHFAKWRPHSVLSVPFQRPRRVYCSGVAPSTALVQWVHPIVG